TLLIADRSPGALGPVDRLSGWRYKRRGLGRIGGRGRGGRLHSHLWDTARPRHGGPYGQPPRAHLLPEDRGRAARDRSLLPNRRRDRCWPARPADAGLARRGDDDDNGAELINEGGDNGKSPGRDVGQGRGRKDNL